MDCHCRSIRSISLLECMAGTTGLEPATSAVTGQRSNQLSYVPLQSVVQIAESATTLWVRPFAKLQTDRTEHNSKASDENGRFVPANPDHGAVTTPPIKFYQTNALSWTEPAEKANASRLKRSQDRLGGEPSAEGRANRLR